MKFKINNEEWAIKEVEQKELCDKNGYEYTENGDYYYGTTYPTTKEILLYKDLDIVQKRKTLYHELMHCYIFTYISFNNVRYEIDDFCDLSANSHDIIHKIADDYFKLKEEK